jgi:hypothetical protein
MRLSYSGSRVYRRACVQATSEQFRLSLHMTLQHSVFNAIAALTGGTLLHASAARWRWRVLVALLCALTAWIAWGVPTLRWMQEQNTGAAHRLLQAQSVMPAAHVPAAPAPADFAAQLNAVPSSQRIVEVLQQSAQFANAQLDAVRMQEHAALPGRLARTDVSIELKAPYAAAKGAIGESLARLPIATVSRMQWRADPVGTLVQVSANLSVWGAPLPSTAAAAPR